MNILGKLDRLLLLFIKTVTLIAFIVIALIITVTIIGRYIRFSLLWSDEIIELLFAYIVFYGSAALWMSREHFSTGDWIERKWFQNERSKHFYRLFLEWIGLLFVIIFFYYSLMLTLSTQAVTNVLAIPKWLFYSCMPVSGFIMIIYSIKNITAEIMAIARPTRRANLNM